MAERQIKQLEKEKEYSNLWFNEAKNNKENNEKYLYPCIENLNLEVAPTLPGSKGDKPFLSFKAQNLEEAKLILNYTIPDLTKRKKVEHGKDNYDFIDFTLNVTKKFRKWHEEEFKLSYISKRFGIMCWIELEYEEMRNFKFYSVIRHKILECNTEVSYSENEIKDFKGKTLRYHGTEGTTSFYYHNKNFIELDKMLKVLELRGINTYRGEVENIDPKLEDLNSFDGLAEKIEETPLSQEQWDNLSIKEKEKFKEI